jgi:hypothetical protein
VLIFELLENMSMDPFKCSDLYLDVVEVTQAVFSIDEGNVSVTLPRSSMSLEVPSRFHDTGSYNRPSVTASNSGAL